MVSYVTVEIKNDEGKSLVFENVRVNNTSAPGPIGHGGLDFDEGNAVLAMGACREFIEAMHPRVIRGESSTSTMSILQTKVEK